MTQMTHMVSLTKEEALKLVADGKLFEVVEAKKDEKTTSFVVGESPCKALEHWARYRNLHTPAFSLNLSTLSVKRARIASMELMDGIQIGAIASEDDASVLLGMGINMFGIPKDAVVDNGKPYTGMPRTGDDDEEEAGVPATAV